MTDKEKELIVNLVKSGKNTLKELRGVAPNERHWNVIGHPDRGGGKNDVVCLDKEMIWSGALHYKPTDADTFHLTDAGYDLLYRLEKEIRKRKLDERTIALSEEANEISRQSLKKAEVSNALAKDSLAQSQNANELSKKALHESYQSKLISFGSLTVAILALLYAFFSGR